LIACIVVSAIFATISRLGRGRGVR